MWEKLSDYFLDISKYLITATFITTFVGDMGEELHWLIYLVSFIFCVTAFFGLPAPGLAPPLAILPPF